MSFQSLKLRNLALAAASIGALANAAAKSVAPEPPSDRGDAFDRLVTRPGAALREARFLLKAREFARAEALLEAVGKRHLVVADHAELLWMRARVESGRIDAAISMAAAWEGRDSPLRGPFFTLLGRAYAARGDEAAARRVWLRAVGVVDDSEQLANLYLSIAESHERTEEYEAAVSAHLEAWTRFPLSDAAEVAGDALDALEDRLEKSLRAGIEYRDRADALYRERRNEEALAAYERALAHPELAGAERQRAERQRAQTLFRLRRYADAARAYASLPADDPTEIELGRARARSGQVSTAIEVLGRVGLRAHSPHAPRANLLAGLLAEGEGDADGARKWFLRAIEGGAGTSYAEVAIWRLGWLAFREAHYQEAIRYFDQLIDGRDPSSELRARYWRARALRALKLDGASEEFAALAREYSLTYYGWRAAHRAPELDTPPRPQPIRDGSRALDESQLERPRILLEAGMIDETRAELDLLYPRARGLADRLALAQLYADAGNYDQPRRLMVDAYQEPLTGTPSLPHLEVWWHAWPAPFEESLRRSAEAGFGVEPGLVYAVMREESGFRPEVVSVAGARGLLQIMPETGQRLARSVPLAEFSPDDLFLPQLNIQLGSAYLAELLEHFDGRVFAAVASYNAGPSAVSRWLDSGPEEEDEWVEAIPYDQTRAYVKRVLRSLHVYRTIY